MAEKNPAIRSLIDIRGLLEKAITAGPETVHIPAGATLQSFIDTVATVNPRCRLLDGIKASCPSRQIRNQRTFGGEIGHNRPNSEILVFLHAVNAELTVHTESESIVSIRDWDGQGIVTGITYYPNQISAVGLERFAVLPSAPAMVIAAGCEQNGQYKFAVGGAALTIQTLSIMANDWNDQVASQLAADVSSQFIADHFGSLSYKKALIATAMKRVVATW